MGRTGGRRQGLGQEAGTGAGGRDRDRRRGLGQEQGQGVGVSQKFDAFH